MGYSKTLGGALALSLMISTANAEVSAAEAAALGKSLTPIGAEQSANKAGTIPAWTGGLTKAPEGYKSGGELKNPYSDDKVKFVITGENYKEYAANLTDGQKAMFAKYPDTYKMPVYETRRTSAYPQFIYDDSKTNATKTKLLANGNGLENYEEGVPFPLPQNGVEAIWNHIVRYRGGSVSRVVAQATPQVNGDYTIVRFKD